MKKKENYSSPKCEEILLPYGCNLLLNLSLEADVIDYEGDELIEDFGD